MACSVRTVQFVNKTKVKVGLFSERPNFKKKKKCDRHESFDKSDLANETLISKLLVPVASSEEYKKEKVLRDLLWRKGPLIKTEETFTHDEPLQSVGKQDKPQTDQADTRESAQDIIKMVNRREKKDFLILPMNKPPSDDEQSCADIAGCDTLFLNIGVHEKPELKAARNLKEKLNKKKELKILPEGSADDRSPVDTDYNGNNSSVSQPGDILPFQDTINQKRKIKIVIGKKTKSKSNRRKSDT